MPVSVTLDQICRLAPIVRMNYRDAFMAGQPVLDHYAISASRLRVAHFLAQVLHESAALTVLYEDLDYRPERLPVVWPSRFRPAGPLDPALYAHNERKLANEVYARRLGNVGPEDGFTYRGRGLLQLTGRGNYARASAVLRLSWPGAPDFTADPDAVIATEWCLAVAAADWMAKGCNELADQDDVAQLTARLNGGAVGLPERIDWTRRTKLIWA